jgi:hypothetical protein
MLTSEARQARSVLTSRLAKPGDVLKAAEGSVLKCFLVRTLPLWYSFLRNFRGRVEFPHRR